MKYYYNVPQILQNPELPNGCEITSMCELLNYYGYDADKCDLADNYLPQSKEWYGEDPDKVYLGNPRLDGNVPGTGYYCFAGPIIEAADKYMKEHLRTSSSYPALKDAESAATPEIRELASGEHQLVPADISGSEEEDLVNYLKDGHPFVFWATLHFGDIQHDPAPAWTLPGGKIHQPLHTLHCMVCCGVDDDFFYIADPLDFNLKVPRAQFMKIYRQLGSRAVILR